MKYNFLYFFILLLFLYQLLKLEKEKFRCVDRKKIKILHKTNKIIKPYYNHNKYFKIKNLYEKYLHKFDFVPRMKFNDKKFEITEDFYKHKLTKKNRPENYVEQLKIIYETMEKNNVYHNEMRQEHIRVKDKKIYLIDFEHTSNKNKIWRWNKPLQYHIKAYK